MTDPDWVPCLKMGYDRHVVNDSVARHPHAQAHHNEKTWIEDEEETVPVMESEGMSGMVYETNSEIGNACRTSKLLIIISTFCV